MYGSVELARADQVLLAAEKEIRQIIEASLNSQRYREVSALAVIAEGISALRRPERLTMSFGRGNGVSEAAAGSTSEAYPDTSPPLAGSPVTPSAPTYPRFEREADRIVKIGWSKGDSRTYEHKAPRLAVDAVTKALRKAGTSFTMDEILPIKDGTGADVPSYQAYIVVGWLRQEGIVARNGNDGYTLNSPITPEDVSVRWDSLPQRR